METFATLTMLSSLVPKMSLRATKQEEFKLRLRLLLLSVEVLMNFIFSEGQ